MSLPPFPQFHEPHPLGSKAHQRDVPMRGAKTQAQLAHLQSQADIVVAFPVSALRDTTEWRTCCCEHFVSCLQICVLTLSS